MRSFIFIHIPRTGGTSTVKALGIKNDSHMTAAHRRTYVSATVWNNAFKFSFVRNPWSRAVSWYRFSKQLKKLPPEQANYYAMPFKDWVLGGMRTHWEVSGVKFNGKHPLNLHEYVIGSGGNLLVDFVGRFEKLQEDFNKVCKWISIPVKRLPHVYKTSSTRLEYRKYYNSQTKKYIQKFFEKDIDMFKYTF